MYVLTPIIQITPPKIILYLSKEVESFYPFSYVILYSMTNQKINRIVRKLTTKITEKTALTILGFMKVSA